MINEIKIVLYPEEHKSKNGKFFEDLMRYIFDKEGYELTQNINFTGLEIDLLGKHKRRNENVLIECKAKQKPKSTEIKNFAYNILIAKKADFGYFVFTEELDHQAAGIVEELVNNQEHNKKFVFLGPDKVLDILIEQKIIKKFDSDLDNQKDNIIFKIIFAYTYFGKFYIPIFSRTSANKKCYRLYNADSLEEITDLSVAADKHHSNKLTIKETLENSIGEIKEYSHEAGKLIESSNGYIELNADFADYLDSTGVSFIHSNADEVNLSDIFVEPNLKRTRVNSKEKIAYQAIRLWDIVNLQNDKNLKLIIIGNETSGKTTICKRIYDRFYQEGFIPILLNGEKIKQIRIDKFRSDVISVFHEQYEYSDYNAIDKIKIVIIIDDFHKFKPTKNEEYRDVLVKNIDSEYKNIIFVGDTLMPLDIIGKDKKIKNIFEKFEIFHILQFGPKLRHELVEKWYCLGRDVDILDVNSCFRQYDEIEKQIESIIGKNYIPAYPFYILTILQILEGKSYQQPDYSLHGFYYEHLINQQLDHAVKNKENISLFYNYITEFSYYLFKMKKKSVSINSFEDFHIFYSDKYDIEINSTEMLNNLRISKLIDVKDGIIKISIDYIYYFFVAKYMTNNFSKDNEIKVIISKMCMRVYREEYANIIMFLTHLSKDPFIVDEIIDNAKNIFAEFCFAELNSDVKNINALVTEIPKQVLELVDAKDVREEELEEKDRIEFLEKEYEKNREQEECDLDESISNINYISKIMMALKTIEILGQIAKKYWGGMTGTDKYNIALETYLLGFRTLTSYFDYITKHKDLIAELIKEIITRKHIRDRFSLQKTAEETTNEFIFRLCFLASFGIIKKITYSIGYDKLSNTFQAILDKNPINSIRLTDISIKLDHHNKLPYKELVKVKKITDNNFLCTLILNNLVIDRLYLFNEDYKDKQRICSLLKIDMKDQRYIDSTSKVKKRS